MTTAIHVMREADVGAAVAMYGEANQFATAEAIEGWTRKNRALFPQYHLVFANRVRVLGAISGTLEGDTGIIEDLAAHASARRHGIGSSLLAELLKKFKEDGVKRVQLWVHKKSVAVLPFYEKHGFKILRTERTKCVPDVPDGEEITILEKVLF